jgi:hypothetical protein
MRYQDETRLQLITFKQPADIMREPSESGTMYTRSTGLARTSALGIFVHTKVAVQQLG